ncbi:hypothetical protein GPALN_002315 [Globodera pallida]|nr:hypothetical protein GPALN_002315 [Globodera pallida]
MAKMDSFFSIIFLIGFGFFQPTQQNEKGFLCFPEASSLTKASVTFRCDELMKENICEATIAQLCNGRQSENDMQFCNDLRPMCMHRSPSYLSPIGGGKSAEPINFVYCNSGDGNAGDCLGLSITLALCLMIAGLLAFLTIAVIGIIVFYKLITK